MIDNQDKKVTDSIVERIKTKAKANGISMSRLATEVEMTDTGFYRMLENGSFKVITLIKIAQVLNTSCAELLGEDVSTSETKVFSLMKEIFKEVNK